MQDEFDKEKEITLEKFRFIFLEFQEYRNKYAKYILCCAFLIPTQWFSIFNNFDKYILFIYFSFFFFLFSARPFAN
jgi:hypothetical protein